MADAGEEERRVAYCLLDAQGQVLAAEDAGGVFYAASTIKLAVLAAVARAVDAGELTWDSPLDGTPLDTTPLDGTVRDLARAMITQSSNEATNVLAGRVGLASVARVLADAGASGCRMQRLIGDEAATVAGLTNEVTPLGLARLLHAIVTGSLTSEPSRALMLDLLRAQEFRVIADVLRPGVDRGSKSGWVERIDHDAAFVGAPDGGDLVVLAVCTAGYSAEDGRAQIRRVAASVLPVTFLA